jgi:hypothetical protein
MAGTKRTPIHRTPNSVITQKAIDLFRLGTKMMDDGIPLEAREFLDVEVALHRELGLAPWHPYMFFADFEPPTDDLTKRRFYEHVLDLRHAFEEAVEP